MHMKSSSNSSSTSQPIKIICVGPASAGKTSLIRRYVLNDYGDIAARFSTRGVDFLSKRIPNPLLFVQQQQGLDEDDGKRGGHHRNNDNKKFVTVQLFDTAGQERRGTILSSCFYRGANAALLIYDATSRKSFQNCVRWFHILKQKLMFDDKDSHHTDDGNDDDSASASASASANPTKLNDKRNAMREFPIVVVANKLDLLYREVSKPMRGE